MYILAEISAAAATPGAAQIQQIAVIFCMSATRICVNCLIVAFIFRQKLDKFGKKWRQFTTDIPSQFPSPQQM